MLAESIMFYSDFTKRFCVINLFCFHFILQVSKQVLPLHISIPINSWSVEEKR